VRDLHFPDQPRLLVRGYVDRPVLAKTLGLRNDQRIILAQSVGYPKKKRPAGSGISRPRSQHQGLE
jgi:hypothetical protein